MVLNFSQTVEGCENKVFDVGFNYCQVRHGGSVTRVSSPTLNPTQETNARIRPFQKI